MCVRVALSSYGPLICSGGVDRMGGQTWKFFHQKPHPLIKWFTAHVREAIIAVLYFRPRPIILHVNSDLELCYGRRVSLKASLEIILENLEIRNCENHIIQLFLPANVTAALIKYAGIIVEQVLVCLALSIIIE